MRTERWLFVFFLVSGFCSLVYEVVWLRLAMAAFGVTTPLVSIVLSVFMGGLALGSWAGGRLARRLVDPRGDRALRLYAVAELVIGASGILVPLELRWGKDLLSRFGGEAAWASGSHYAASAAWIGLALLPFCTAMGATFPLAMAAVRRSSPESARRSFSYLYLANVLGATSGTLASAFVLIEMLGFRGSGFLAAALNGLLAAGAFALSRSGPSPASAPSKARSAKSASRAGASLAPAVPTERSLPWLLFTTGLVSMAMEVVWVRQFTPFLGTVVYAFASILAFYLAATFLGSALYRRAARASPGGGSLSAETYVWIAALAAALLPLLFADPRLSRSKFVLIALTRVGLGLTPLCAAVGFLTPMLVDRYSAGDPDRAGRSYAFNVVGCILGPLLACFVLLPRLGERGSLLVLAAPLAAIGLVKVMGRPRTPGKAGPSAKGLATALAAASAIGLPLVFLTKDFETIFPERIVRRDYTATVIATGQKMDKQLLVNGQGMTVLTPVTKMMAHLPLTLLRRTPRQTLVICFGMGTAFRSTISWGVPCTAVELIPSVPPLFEYFHSDAPKVLASPGARIVVDDGRRFLERSREQFDVVTIDPPPPVEAAGSSLLYSREFYETVKKRLAPGGIVQQWFPGGQTVILASVARAVGESFPHVRVYRSMQGWGFHFLASMEPIPAETGTALAMRMPAAAAADLVEWMPGSRPVQYFDAVLAQELPLETLERAVPDAPVLLDDRPVNEYFFLRWLAGKAGAQ